MEIRFTDDELIDAVTAIVNGMADEAGLADRDRAMLQRWRSAKAEARSANHVP